MGTSADGYRVQCILQPQKSYKSGSTRNSNSDLSDMVFSILACFECIWAIRATMTVGAIPWAFNQNENRINLMWYLQRRRKIGFPTILQQSRHKSTLKSQWTAEQWATQWPIQPILPSTQRMTEWPGQQCPCRYFVYDLTRQFPGWQWRYGMRSATLRSVSA